MPVDFTPVILLFFAIALPLCLALMRWFRTSAVVALLEIALLAIYLVHIYWPVWQLEKAARSGNPVAQFKLSEQLLVIFVAGQHVSYRAESVHWLKESAKQEYPPAIYALGVMYKFGEGIPGISATNAEPIKGQALIDKALAMGFEPSVSEHWYYGMGYGMPGRPVSPGAQWLQAHPDSGAPTSSWSMAQSVPSNRGWHGVTQPSSIQKTSFPPTTATTQEHGGFILLPIVYDATMVGVDFERLITISPDGEICTVLRPAHGVVNVTRGQLTDAQVAELIQTFKGWEKLKSRYNGVAAYVQTIRYGSKSVTNAESLHVPKLFREVCFKIEQLAARQAPTSAPAANSP